MVNTMSHPMVSVCIPTYRYGRFIGQAIESVLAQQFTDFELLIVDDASPDSTREVVERYAAQDSRIRFEVNAVNRGMVPNWNYCLEQARGRYIKFLFGDDFLCSPTALGQMVECFERDANVSLLFSARRFVDETGVDIRLAEPFGRRQRRLSGKRLINYCLTRMNNPIGEPSTVMFRKGQGLRGFDPRYQQLVDLEMWLYLLQQGDGCYLSEPLSAFRVHGAQQTTVNVRFLQDDRLLLVREYLQDQPSLQRYLEYCQYYAWWKLARSGSDADRAPVLERIRERYPLWLFYLLLPVYKLATPLYKLVLPLFSRV